MDALPAFMRETYIIKPDNRIPVKDIYEDFRTWYIEKYGASAWNNITQRQVYALLKSFPDYSYVRYREGYCLKGIAYKSAIKRTDNAGTQVEEQFEPQTIQPANIYLTLKIVKTEVPTIENLDTGNIVKTEVPTIVNLDTDNIQRNFVKTELLATLGVESRDIHNNIVTPQPQTMVNVEGGNLKTEQIKLNVLDVKEYKIERLAPRVPKIVLPRAFQSAALNIKK